MQMGSDGFSAQYQQMPVPPGGAMIKRHWIVRYKELPPISERILVMQSWDTANKGGPQNDWSVCTTWVLARGMRWYLVDVWRGRVDYPALKSMVESHAKHCWLRNCSRGSPVSSPSGQRVTKQAVWLSLLQSSRRVKRCCLNARPG
jgi:hypothetical protein